ncbi:MAG: hypothetical protein EA402_03565 [Planctomycetota bacterium]|nr:MAG: hypothetical protein EA402_03565 [Planctomycetota bacterium]
MNLLSLPDVVRFMRIPIVNSSVALTALLALGSPLLCGETTEPPGTLPITALEIRPDGAWALRQGMVDGSGQVLGLPADFNLQRSRFAVAGDGPPLMPRLERQFRDLLGDDRGNNQDIEGPELAPRELSNGAEDDEAFDRRIHRLNVLEQELKNLDEDEDHLRRQLNRINALGREQSESSSKDGERAPNAEQLGAAMAFIEAEQARLLSTLSTIADRREAIHLEQYTLDSELLRPLPPVALVVTAAAGRRLSLIHPVDGLRWAPSYRIRIDHDQALLVRDALIDANLSTDLSIGRLTLHGSSTLNQLGPPSIDITHLTVTDARPPQEPGETARSRELRTEMAQTASESSVWTTGQQLLRLQRADGSWGDEPHRVSSTALAVLAFLGSGYDHRTPNRYRRVVQRGMSFLAQHAASNDQLSTQALVTRTLAEAQAMTNDPELTPKVQQAMAQLAALADSPAKLEAALSRRGPLEGPVAVALTAMTLNSVRASNVETNTETLSKALKALRPQLNDHRDRHLGALVQAVISIHQGAQPFATNEKEGHRRLTEWLAHSAEWIEAGQMERVLFATLVFFQAGGENWTQWNAVHSPRMIQVLHLIHTRDNISTVIPHPLGDVAALALVEMSMQFYYRYTPPQGGQPLRATQVRPPPAPRPSLPNLSQALGPWPLVLDLGAVTLEAGSGLRRLRVDEHPLPGSITRVTVPAVNPGVWRVLHTRNPLPTVLAAGQAEVVVDALPIGSTQLPLVPPGQPLRLDLGRDERFHVQRSVSREEREIGGRRVHTVTITFTVHGPDGVAVEVQEALPRPASPEIRLRSIEPAWNDDRLDRALHEDPRWLLNINPSDGVATATIQYELRHPAHLRLHENGATP